MLGRTGKIGLMRTKAFDRMLEDCILVGPRFGNCFVDNVVQNICIIQYDEAAWDVRTSRQFCCVIFFLTF